MFWIGNDLSGNRIIFNLANIVALIPWNEDEHGAPAFAIKFTYSKRSELAFFKTERDRNLMLDQIWEQLKSKNLTLFGKK